MENENLAKEKPEKNFGERGVAFGQVRSRKRREILLSKGLFFHSDIWKESHPYYEPISHPHFIPPLIPS